MKRQPDSMATFSHTLSLSNHHLISSVKWGQKSAPGEFQNSPSVYWLPLVDSLSNHISPVTYCLPGIILALRIQTKQGYSLFSKQSLFSISIAYLQRHNLCYLISQDERPQHPGRQSHHSCRTPKFQQGCVLLFPNKWLQPLAKVLLPIELWH